MLFIMFIVIGIRAARRRNHRLIEALWGEFFKIIGIFLRAFALGLLLGPVLNGSKSGNLLVV